MRMLTSAQRLTPIGLKSDRLIPLGRRVRLREDWGHGAHGASIEIPAQPDGRGVAIVVRLRGVRRDACVFWLRPRDQPHSISEAAYNLDCGSVAYVAGYDGAPTPHADIFTNAQGVSECFIAVEQAAANLQFDIWIRQDSHAPNAHQGAFGRGVDVFAIECGVFAPGRLEAACARAGLSLHQCGFATVKDYTSKRFNLHALQHFLDDPAKHNGSIRDAFEQFIDETGPEAFTLVDYARMLGAPILDADEILGGAEHYTKPPISMVCRMPFASNEGIGALREVCSAERDWCSGVGASDPRKTIPQSIVGQSPLLLAGSIFAAQGVKDARNTLGRLSADRFCLGSDQLLEHRQQRKQRWGAFVLRLSADP